VLRQRVSGAGFGGAMSWRTRPACRPGQKKDFRQYDMLPTAQKQTILHAFADSITLPETTWIPF
jgi:hypothetical protein